VLPRTCCTAGMRLRREAVWEYLRGALWVLPGISILLALGAGSVLSAINVAEHSPLHRLVFQGTADDARTLLIGIAGTMITVIALILGLTVVALQMSSTQFSPRLLRNFLQDRHNQLVLSAFVATFAYSAAGLYTVGVSAGNRTTEFPRLAVTGAIALLFVSLLALVYEFHHVAHSMQVDEIMRRVERNTHAVIRECGPDSGDVMMPEVPGSATIVRAVDSGYVQTIHPEPLVEAAVRDRVSIRVAARVGDHVVTGSPLGWVWGATPEAPDAASVSDALHTAIRIGFERTLEQDAAFGMRQLVDIASKALSPAINDPYTAVQAVDHLGVLVASLARRPLSPRSVHETTAGTTVAVPAYAFADYLDLACAQIRRYGSAEPTVGLALIRLLRAATYVTTDPGRRSAIAGQLELLLTDTERDVRQPADFVAVRVEAAILSRQLSALRGDGTEC
jgi:uncharacterized membrane protein